MNRRGFLQRIVTATTALAVGYIPKFKPKKKLKVRWCADMEQDLYAYKGICAYKGTDILDAGYIYAPYIPFNTSKDLLRIS
jgi:hypothetical protein